MTLFKHIAGFALTSSAIFAQAQTPLKVYQSAGSATGSIWLQERRTNGTHWFKFSAQDSIAADIEIFAPNALPATNGECVKGTTAGVLSFGSCDSLWTASGSDIYRATGKVGIQKTTPTQTLHVFAPSASPATTGTAQNGILRVEGDATNTLDIGAYAGSPFGLWLQATNTTALGTTYPLILNPNGGNVGIGMTAPTSTLHVTGTATVTSTTVLSGNVTLGANVSMSGAMTPALDGTGTIGSSGTRYTSAHLYSLNVGGGSGTITFLPGSAPTVGHVWTATSTAGVGAWQAVSVTAPLTLTLGATGYSQPLTIANNTVGLNGSCLGVAGHDSGSTVYTLGRLCAKFESALFTDEIVELQTVTGSGTFATAQSWKNLTTTMYGNATIASGSSLLMDRATRATNQKAYWTVAGNASTTGAWSTGTTPSGATSRWVIDHNGAEIVTIEEGGLTTLSAGLTATGNITGAVINATGSPAYRVNGTSIIDASRNASFVNLTLSGTVSSSLSPTSDSTYSLGASDNEWLSFFSDQATVTSYVRPKVDNGATDGSSSRRWSAGYWYTGDFAGVLTLGSTITGNHTPTASNTYTIGTSSAYYNQMASETFFVESGSIRPRSGGVGTVGISTGRFAKAWLVDLSFTGTLTPPSGTALNGTTTCAAGEAVKAITFSQGIATAITCAVP